MDDLFDESMIEDAVPEVELDFGAGAEGAEEFVVEEKNETTKETTEPKEEPVEVKKEKTDESGAHVTEKEPNVTVTLKASGHISEIISPVEETLPLNTPDQPQPTLFRIDKNSLQEHQRHVRSFPKNSDVKHPDVPKFIDPEHKIRDDVADYDYKVFSEKGETKVTANGHLLGGRKYLCSTFTLPGRGKRLYMLANEAAKALNFRDAFMLFHRAKNMMKIEASDTDRQFLIEAGFNVTKMKSRAVGIVTARGAYMSYGARIILYGKRVVDDYWEEAAVEQGFTEKDHVFPVDKNYGQIPPRSNKAKESHAAVKPRVVKPLYVTPVPPLEDRLEYLANSSKGEPTQVLPGQGISGGLELASIATTPQYKADVHANQRQQNKVLLTLMDNGPGSIPSATVTSLPVSDEHAGKKSASGLPFFKRSIAKRIDREDLEKLREIEYLHGTVDTNTIINSARAPRNRQWQAYWQAKSGVEMGLTKDNADDFLKKKEESLKHEETETRYNEYLNCDQVITKKRRANPNFLGHGNIDGHKPPYAERPPMAVSDQQNMMPMGMVPPMHQQPYAPGGMMNMPYQRPY